jgi:hypothetical protein
MDYTQEGISSHVNFTPSSAALLGGPNAYALPSIYSPGGAVVVGYLIRPWPLAFSSGRCMEFSFTANSFKYDITSISFRLRRSDTGPKQIKLRSNIDGFTSDLTSSTLVNENVFYPFSVPTSFNNLSDNTFAIRIYGYNPSNTTLGVLWFDEIIINGQVLQIILPVDLTYFKAEHVENKVNMTWETAWEKNSDEFVVERSSDMVRFEEIGSLPASGETTGRTQYSFTDETPLSGVSYYRLRMVDRDQSFSFSPTRDVLIHDLSARLEVSPNPATTGNIRIQGSGIDPAFLILTDHAGRRIPVHYESFVPDFLNLIPKQPLSSGLYLLIHDKNGRKEHVKVLVP